MSMCPNASVACSTFEGSESLSVRSRGRILQERVTHNSSTHALKWIGVALSDLDAQHMSLYIPATKGDKIEK